ncbi:hypothetical protein [Flavobacterium cerinum]|uniref:DUF4375 domain-containing protein n=1 Tax=Flavobacterium cerinum TaxID=2502784 RepID=A0ABY5IPY4_9FLAO|nr:hypothetical protein [Flavobacterium cerinum]UUC44908.1 hypothetical protein NOX80_14910 [Flavobacterium cerinum]
MEQLKELKDLNTLLKAALAVLRPKITEELVQILNGTAIMMLPTYEKGDIATFNFEYSREWLSVVFFGSNARGLTITEDISFLRNELKEYFSKVKEVMDMVEEMEDDTEEWEEMIEEYNEEKSSIYDNWFGACWEEAQTQTQNRIPAYYSDNESDLGIELLSNTIVEINKNQSIIRYYSN